MPGRVSEALSRRAPRRWRALRALMLAVVLAGFSTLLGVGAASADYWPHGETGATTAQHR
jgi:hypothetical protein